MFSLGYEAAEKISNTENPIAWSPLLDQNGSTIWVSQEHKSMMDLPTIFEDVYTSQSVFGFNLESNPSFVDWPRYFHRRCCPPRFKKQTQVFFEVLDLAPRLSMGWRKAYGRAWYSYVVHMPAVPQWGIDYNPTFDFMKQNPERIDDHKIMNHPAM